MGAHRAWLGLPALAAGVLLGLTAVPAAADHTDPTVPQASLAPALPGTALAKIGTWEFIKNFPPNPGTDLKFFTHDGVTYGIAGSLGQASTQYAGQRIVTLMDADGTVAPEWVADHGSAHCSPSRAVTGLQHDTVVTPPGDAELAIDTTDANDRCHDPQGGGMEIIDISGVGREGGAPVRELHLIRFDGTSHTATLDATRPWIVYNSNSDENRPWIDVVDIRTCLGLGSASLEAKRGACRPSVYRMPFDPTWTSQVEPSNGQLEAPHGCHDITAVGDRLYCAGINGTAIFDVSGLTAADGSINGTPLTCTVIDGTSTAAKVSDCRVTAAQWEEAGKPAATGWSHVGHFNHPGRDATNGQLAVPSDQGVSISHEADPTPDGRWLLVTDERGGGVVPPGSTCAPTVQNPVGNGGLHVFDISNPAAPKYATTPEGEKAVFISTNLLPAPTFCNIHVIHHLEDEQRIIAAWYSQGIKVLDYEIDDQGRWTFTEVGALTLPGAQTWTVEPFKIVDNDDGTRTYTLMASDIGRGIDVVSFTAEPNFPPTAAAGGPASDGGDTEVAGVQETRNVGSLAATGENTPVELGALLLLGALVLRLATGRRLRRTWH